MSVDERLRDAGFVGRTLIHRHHRIDCSSVADDSAMALKASELPALFSSYVGNDGNVILSCRARNGIAERFISGRMHWKVTIPFETPQTPT